LSGNYKGKKGQCSAAGDGEVWRGTKDDMTMSDPVTSDLIAKVACTLIPSYAEATDMPIDKSPPWRAVSWETKYPEDKDDPPREDGLAYWMIESVAGYTVAAEWMTEEQARMIAAAPELAAALKQSLAGHYATWMAARAEVEGASVSAALFEKEPEVIVARAALAKATGNS
jgi:hypothetical protein